MSTGAGGGALTTLSPYWPDVYHGADVSSTFTKRWLGKDYTGAAAPYARVRIRRGFFHHALHSGRFPTNLGPVSTRDRKPPTFGNLVGHSAYSFWCPTWTPLTDWVDLPGVSQIDLDQAVNFAGNNGGDGSGGSSGSNGIAVATVTCDNAAWTEVAGELGAYHTKQRGWLWPWRGYTPPNRPGGGVAPNQWYNQVPNAQIIIEQGYGSDAAVYTFTGLIDTAGPGTIRPDKITLTARDFGGGLTDRFVFAWNKDKRLNDPIRFIPSDYKSLPSIRKIVAAGKGGADYIVINEATDAVRFALMWCGFKEWEIEDSGVALKTPHSIDKTNSWMDVINSLAADLGYVFFIAEPTDDDLSIGVPVFRKQSILKGSNIANPIYLDSTILTDSQPTHSNTNDRFIIRARGEPAKRSAGGRAIIGGDMTQDGQIRYTYTYWPPWMPDMAGVIKQLTYYDAGAKGILGFTSNRQCAVACLLIAIQIAMGRDTWEGQAPANPAIGLDSFAYINDAEASGIASRVYVQSRKSTMTLGGDGSSGTPRNGPGSSNTTMLWYTQFGGSLIDNPEWDQVRTDYKKSLEGAFIGYPKNWEFGS